MSPTPSISAQLCRHAYRRTADEKIRNRNPLIHLVATQPLPPVRDEIIVSTLIAPTRHLIPKEIDNMSHPFHKILNGVSKYQAIPQRCSTLLRSTTSFCPEEAKDCISSLSEFLINPKKPDAK
jgi:hypothetical protein